MDGLRGTVDHVLLSSARDTCPHNDRDARYEV
jgi:hypothetical protein